MCGKHKRYATRPAYQDVARTDEPTTQAPYEGQTIRLGQAAEMQVEPRRHHSGFPWALLWLIWPMLWLVKGLAALLATSWAALGATFGSAIIIPTLPWVPILLIGAGIFLFRRRM